MIDLQFENMTRNDILVLSIMIENVNQLAIYIERLRTL